MSGSGLVRIRVWIRVGFVFGLVMLSICVRVWFAIGFVSGFVFMSCLVRVSGSGLGSCFVLVFVS